MFTVDKSDSGYGGGTPSGYEQPELPVVNPDPNIESSCSLIIQLIN